MKTALEILDKNQHILDIYGNSAQGAALICDIMIAFAKQHVQAALDLVKIDIINAEQEKYGTHFQDCWDENTIIKIYPLENIK